MSRDPKTPAEWQEAVDAAECLLLVDSCRQYGLIEGGPKVNLGRCEQLLARGRVKGFRPTQAGIERELAQLLAVGR